MLYTLTFRVFLPSVATTATIMAPYALKKFYALQTCTPGMVDGVSGISSMLSAFARIRLPAVSP